MGRTEMELRREKEKGGKESGRRNASEAASRRERREKREERKGERGREGEEETESTEREERGVSLELSCRRMRALRLAAEGEARQRLLIHQDPPTNPR